MIEVEPREEYVINEEYKVWKKNTPFLYDLVITKALEWPSLSCQWLPDVQVPSGADYSIQQLLLGTHTSEEEQNYLMVAEVRIPASGVAASAAIADAQRAERDETGAGGRGGTGSGQHSVFGFGGVGKVDVVQKINHDGEVNRARCCPQRPSLVATKTVTADVYVFDTQKHPLKPPPDGACVPQLKLKGHKKEGYGLSWSPFHVGHVISGGEDSLVCYWDVQAATAHHKTVDPLHVFQAHSDVIEDVAFHCHQAHVFGSVGDDCMLNLWDLRAGDMRGKPMMQVKAHVKEVNCLAFSPFHETVLVTGSADKTVGLWDMRNLSERAHSFEAHNDEVLQVAWSPYHETILASASADRRINLWSLSEIGAEQTPEDAEDGPPELLFVHGGHTSKLSDFTWNPNEPWVLASVAEDNILQIWQMAEHIYDSAEAPKEISKEDMMVDDADLE